MKNSKHKNVNLIQERCTIAANPEMVRNHYEDEPCEA